MLVVHAHPDDEASKGAGTVAKYHDEGIRTVLVCCTGGEAGDILNPAMDRPEIRENLADVRLAELHRSAEILGYDRVAMLGYRDSGMADMEENAHPEAFANAPLDEAVERLVRLIREERPQVIVCYSDHQTGYLHPDHLRVNEITVPAFHAAGDPEAFPDAGEPWAPSKLYYTIWAKERILLTHEACLEHHGESPFEDDWLAEREGEDHLISARIDTGRYWNHRCDALLAHATQVDPNEGFWFPLPREVAATLYPWDDYELAVSTVDTQPIEYDLFEGLRDRADQDVTSDDGGTATAGGLR